jgi:membrane protease YdiL (CAAX protease family)
MAIRNQKGVILQRFTSVGVVTLCFLFLSPFDWSMLGFPPSIVQNLVGAFIGLLILAILYAGPLVFAILDPDSEIIFPLPSTMVSFRNIIFAPLIEEIAFRSCMIPVMLNAGFSSTAAIFLTPIFFGLAHIHHVFTDDNEVVKVKFGMVKRKIRKVYLVALLQATYTTVFGFICSFLFIRTGTVMAPFFAHIFCNYMGLPSLDFIETDKKNGTPLQSQHGLEQIYPPNFECLILTSQLACISISFLFFFFSHWSSLHSWINRILCFEWSSYIILRIHFNLPTDPLLNQQTLIADIMSPNYMWSMTCGSQKWALRSTMYIYCTQTMALGLIPDRTCLSTTANINKCAIHEDVQ